MTSFQNRTFHRISFFFLFAVALAGYPLNSAYGQSNEDCLGCHEDLSLEAEDGRLVGVDSKLYAQSIHNTLECVNCHDQPGADFEDIPHFDRYQAVDCADCHDQATNSYRSSFHGAAYMRSEANAPNCYSCHGINSNPHGFQPLDLRTAEESCRRCHSRETKLYDTSVHFTVAQQGKDSPGCISCHPTHDDAMPPSAGAVNRICVRCHSEAMQQVRANGHTGMEAIGDGVMSCASCHNVHNTNKPHLDEKMLEACNNCHPGYREQFTGTVHEALMKSGKLNCLSCHRAHHVPVTIEGEQFGCGACHESVEQRFRTSAHRRARLHGGEVAAICADCHTGHHVHSASEPKSPSHRDNIPASCGKCHGEVSVVTSEFVRLPISLPPYISSVHGTPDNDGRLPAVCTDCHGVHDLQSASSPASTINKQNLAGTCGKCHSKESTEYSQSIHGRALASGITDSPSCTDCHDEHLILPVDSPQAAVSIQRLAHETCGKCHEDPEMSARYGLPMEVISSYDDTYHGWAIKRGGNSVAVCIDCHNVHDIRSPLDPKSSIHVSNVVETCKRCHQNSNTKFAASYSHIIARDKMMTHDWVRLVYIWFIVIVLGGMVIHNVIIFSHEVRKRYRRHRRKRAIRRMTRSEIIQHIVLVVSFFALALSGFALRFSDTWWGSLLTDIGLTEEYRRIFHRSMAVILIVASVYHILYLIFTKRGNHIFRGIAPRPSDIKLASANIAYYLGLRKEKARFGMYDYTQKAEYWALVWGTFIMGITGFVLWFPTIATSWLPAWVVRVCGVVHLYEAILAVSAVFIWHFFFVIFLPKEYPMSWIWITGRMPVEEWQEHHALEAGDSTVEVEELPGEKGSGKTTTGEGL